MRRLSARDLLHEKKAFTLIELVLSIGILAIIIIAFLNIFVFSANTNRASEDVLDATYIAQGILEKRYQESQKGLEIPSSDEYLDPYEGERWVHESVSLEDNLVRLIVKVYADKDKKLLESQMETYLLWELD